MVLPYLGTALEQTYSVGVALLARPLARSPALIVHAVWTRSRVEAQLQAFHAAVGRQPVKDRRLATGSIDRVDRRMDQRLRHALVAAYDRQL